MSAPALHRGLGPGSSKCRSCGKRIVWARTTSGKTGPFEEDPQGLWILVNGEAKYVGPGPLQLTLGEAPPVRYSSHFAQCPQANTWRRTPTD